MARSEKTLSVTIPPPVGGWNTLQPISEMEPIYAVDMVNYFPNNGTVDLRKGSRIFVDETGILPGSMTPFTLSDGTKYLLIFGATYANSITTAGTVADVTGTFTGSGGAFASHAGYIFVKAPSNTDVFSWNGTGNFAAAAFTGPSGDDKDLFAMCSYKGRLYMAQRTAPSIWYTATIGAVTGALTEFDLEPFLVNGGLIAYVGTISPNTNNLREQYFLIITYGGDVLLYQGDEPSSSTWALAAQYTIGSPVGRYAFVVFRNDVLVITNDGIVSINAIINGAPLENSYLTDNIQSGFKDSISFLDTTAAGDYVTGVYYPLGNFILFAIPASLDGSDLIYDNLVFNTVNKAWTKFKGWNSNVWKVFNNKLMYLPFTGSSKLVMQAYTGDYDEDFDNPGQKLNIETKLRCAFNYLGNRDRVKIPTQAVPILYESEGLSLTIDCDVDYTDNTATSTVPDTADTSYKLYKPTCGLTAPGPGKAVSIRFDGDVTTKRRSIQAIEVFYKVGDIR